MSEMKRCEECGENLSNKQSKQVGKRTWCTSKACLIKAGLIKNPEPKAFKREIKYPRQVVYRGGV